jgi:hypothetical protein
LRKLENIASGLFILAATIVRYVSDVEYGDPERRLTDFFAFMSEEKRDISTNPLQTLDHLYAQILSEIPGDVYPTTKRILAFHPYAQLGSATVSFYYNFLRMDQNMFHNAVKRLHSLFDIPPRDTNGSMCAHHASFSEYLESRSRSGKFHIDAGYAYGTYQWCVCSGTKLCWRILVGFQMVCLWKMRIVAVISVYRAIRFIRRNFKVSQKYVFA